MPSYSYRDVLERYDRAKAFGETRTLPEYAQHLNDIYQTQDYSAGLRDGWWTRASTRADQVLGDTVGQVTGPIGEAVGSLFDQPEAGARMGEGLPRALLQTLPLYLAGPEAGIPATVAALGTTGLAFGAQTYADTGSPKAAAISGVTAAALPMVGGAFGGAASRIAGGTRVAGDLAEGGAFNRILGSTAAGNVGRVEGARFAGSQAGMLGANVASQYAQNRALGGNESLGDILTSPDLWLNQIPFTVYDAVNAHGATPLTKEGVTPLLKPPVVKKPPVHTPTAGSPEATATVAAMTQQFEEVNNTAGATPEQKSAALQGILESVLNPEKVQAAKDAQKAATPDEPIITLNGQADKIGNGNYRVLVRSHNDIQNGPPLGSTVFINGVEPDAQGNFQVKPSQIQSATFALDPKAQLDPTQNPELPVQRQRGIGGGELPTYESPPLEGQPVEEPKLSTADVKGLNEMGVPPEHVATLQPQEIPAVKQAIETSEKAQLHADAAKKAIAQVPTKAEEWEQLVEPTHIKPTEGATATQDVEAARLATHTPQLDDALQEQEAAQQEVQHLVRPDREADVHKGSLKDEAGGRKTFPSESQAEEWFADYRRSNPDDKKTYALRDDGRGGYYYAEVLNRKTSLDAPRNEGGGTLHEAIGEATPQMHEEVNLGEAAGELQERRPDLNIAALVKNLDLASRSLLTFSNHTGLDVDESRIVLQQAKVILPKVMSGEVSKLPEMNAALREAKIPEFTDEAEMRRSLRLARDGADEFDGMRHYGLDSEIPSNPELVKQIGIQESLTKALNWWSGLKGNEVMGGMLRDMMKALPGMDSDVDIQLPGMAGHNPQEGWMYTKKSGVRSNINVSYLPHSMEDAMLWGLELSHEVTHYATHEMAARNDPAAMEFKAKLSEVREALARNKTIPKDVRKLMSRIAAEDHAQKIASGEWTPQEMTADWEGEIGKEKARDWFQVLYSASNNDELIAQVFGSPEVVALLQDMRMPKNIAQTVLDFFTSSWNKLFGRGADDSALAQILTKFDSYLVPQGYRNGFNARDYIRETLLSSGTRDVALPSRLKTIEDMANKGDLFHSILGFQREGDAGQLPVTAEYGLIDQKLRSALSLGAPKDVHAATMGLLVDDLPVAQELWYRMQTDVKMAKQVRAEVEQGLLLGSVNPKAAEVLRFSELKVETMEKALVKQMNALRRMNDLQNFDPSGYREMIGDQLTSRRAMPEAPDPTGAEDEARGLLGITERVSPIVEARREAAMSGMKISPIDKFFKLTQFLSEEEPAFKPFYRITGEAQGNAFKRVTELNFVKNADPKTGELDEGIKNANVRVARNEGLNNIYSALRRRANVMDQEGTTVTFDDPEMKALLMRASTEKNRKGSSDRDDLIKAFNAENHRLDHRLQVTIPDHLTQMNVNNTALAIIGNEIGMKSETAFDLAKQVYSALAAAKDPAQAMLVGPMMQQVQAQMKPDTFLKVLGQAQGLIADAEKHLSTLRKFPNYTGEQRYGNFHLVMSKGEDRYRKDFDSREDAQARAKELRQEGWQLEDIIPRNATNVNGVADDAVVASMRELDQQALARGQQILQGLPLEQQQQILPLLQRSADYESSMAAFSPIPSQASPRRMFRAGREELDMVANANQENARLINWMRHREVRSQSAVASLDPSILGNRELAQLAQQHVDSQLAPDNPLARRLSEATFYYHLAGNFGVDFLHGIQSLTTGMASVIAETGGVGDAFEYIGKATKAVGKRYLPGGDWETPEQKAFINWLVARGSAGLPTWSDVFDPNQAMIEDAAQPKTTLEAIGSKLKWGIRGYKNIFSKHNDMVLGLAGFQLGLDRGMSFDDAAHFGEDVKNRGNYSAGKNQRGIRFYGMKTRAVPQLFGALQNYTFGWFSQLSHNYKVGFGDAPKGTTDIQILGAKKAFLYQLGAQAILAGALGLPGVGQGMALLKQTTGYDLKDKSMQWLADAFDEDLSSGGMLTGLAMHGAVAQLMPFDPSGRHIPNFPFLGIKPTNGFSLDNLAPAPFATAADLIRGIQAAAKGDTQGMISALPTAARGPMALWQGEGDVRSSSGNLITRMSPAEQFTTALGLTPSRIARVKDINQAAAEASAAATKQKSAAINDIATTYRRDGAAEGQKKLLEFLQQNPQEDAKTVAGIVAQHVTDQSVEKDWRQQVNVGADVTGLPTTAPAQNEDRLLLHNSVLQSLGVPPRTSPMHSQYAAQQIDWLMNTQGQTRAQAQPQVEPRKRIAPPSYIAPSNLGWQ